MICKVLYVSQVAGGEAVPSIKWHKYFYVMQLFFNAVTFLYIHAASSSNRPVLRFLVAHMVIDSLELQTKQN